MFGDSVIESYKRIIKKIKKSKLSDNRKKALYSRANKMLEEYKDKRSYLIKNNDKGLEFLSNLYDEQNQIIELIDFEEQEQEELKKIDKSFVNLEKRKKLLILYNRVYKNGLYSITQDFNFNKEISERTNINIAKSKLRVHIMVRKTMNPYVYKEILTGIKIPVYEKEINDGIPYGAHCYIPKKPYYVIDFKTTWKRSLDIASYDEVKAYVDKYSDNMDEFRDYLNSIIDNAEQCYQNALSSSYNGYYGEKVKIKSLVKKYK